MKINLKKTPFKMAESSGLFCNGLTEDQLKLLQRFHPNFKTNHNFEKDDINVLNDTNDLNTNIVI
ncbi:hypothetical protein BpHYR1_005877 [Brachionus plicatilis]|uniref:Uncharacterized protein n=1 Tax=Brachionus plicatilis TaxID=10195 RepID=A0A3M7T9N7_BRAPC|nr:hypothetical protein BpHYR1_005877 [Brachionus plicatilis]